MKIKDAYDDAYYELNIEILITLRPINALNVSADKK